MAKFPLIWGALGISLHRTVSSILRAFSHHTRIEAIKLSVNKKDLFIANRKPYQRNFVELDDNFGRTEERGGRSKGRIVHFVPSKQLRLLKGLLGYRFAKFDCPP